MANREVLRTLLLEHGLTQARGAELISATTRRPCSVRAIRSWLNDPAKPSTRPCPDWAISALTDAVATIHGEPREEKRA